ncbi:MAG: Nif3-like dinuclear metal center hexameric protein [Planctomycetota bacterium]
MPAEPLTPQDVLEHLTGLWASFDQTPPAKSVDRIIAGPRDQAVKAIAVCWMPYSTTLHNAATLGANLVVTHEPTFWDHFELKNDASDPKPTLLRSRAEKAALIDELELTIIRCHDLWDALPVRGVPFAWAEHLELGDVLASKPYYRVHRIEPRPASEVAAAIAKRTALLGQPVVEFYGDPDHIVRTVGVGTGCASDPFELYDMGADLAVAVDDIVRGWVAGEWCHDTGTPLVVVNHGVAEETGMTTLTDELRTAFPETPVHHLEQGCTYATVTGVGLTTEARR